MLKEDKRPNNRKAPLKRQPQPRKPASVESVIFEQVVLSLDNELKNNEELKNSLTELAKEVIQIEE